MKILCHYLFFFQVFIFQSPSLAQTNDSFHIKGCFEGNYHGYIYLKYDCKDGIRVKDSVLIDNGKFSFHGQVNGYVRLASLRLTSESIRCDEPNGVCFSLDNSMVSIKVIHNQFQEIIVTGVLTADTLNAYIQKQNEIETKIGYFQKQQGKTNDFDSLLSLQTMIDLYVTSRLSMDKIYWGRNPNSNISPFLLARNSSELSTNELIQAYSILSTVQQKSYYGLKVKSDIEERNEMLRQVGLKAPLFITKDVNNVTVKLDSISKKNIVLLDFWASWCVPCRTSHPHLITLYNKYKHLGFEIIGIAANDFDETNWRGAITKDKLNWINILSMADPKVSIDADRDISGKYKISSIPLKILIDKNGVILGRYDGNEEKELDKKLNEIFSK